MFRKESSHIQLNNITSKEENVLFYTLKAIPTIIPNQRTISGNFVFTKHQYHGFSKPLRLEGERGYATETYHTFISIDTPCDSFPCINGGTCRNDGNNFRCICPQGYAGAQCESKFIVRMTIQLNSLNSF